jgi:pimeloyl-ACP methyl ester carboxylesterase
LATVLCGTAAADAAPALVLLHAFPLDHRMWEPAANLLADLPLVLVDLPGAGFSPVTVPTIDAAAEALVTTLDRAGIDRWVVAGVSMGGYVAMAVARLYPGRLAGLALIDTKPQADDAGARAARHDLARRVLAAGSAEPVLGMADTLLGPATRAAQPDLVDQVRSWIASGDSAGIAWAATAMAARPDATGTLGGLRVPTAVIVGEDDSFSPPAVARAMAARIPRAELTELPGVGHLSPVEAPSAVAGVLRSLHGRAIKAGRASDGPHAPA